jgi:hypothetical protein
MPVVAGFPLLPSGPGASQDRRGFSLVGEHAGFIMMRPILGKRVNHKLSHSASGQLYGLQPKKISY